MTDAEISAARFRRWDNEPPPPPLSRQVQDIIVAAFAGAFPKRKGGR
jgi:hypothetical protein